MDKTRKFWGWGYEEDSPSPEEQDVIGRVASERYGGKQTKAITAPKLNDLDLPQPRVQPPADLSSFCTDSPLERAGHTYGKAFRDIARALRRDFSAAPDFVALPKTEEEISRLFDWCENNRVAAIPHGGGSSVVGGTEARNLDRYKGAVSVDLRHFDRLLEIDKQSRAARMQGGMYGPALEDALRPEGLTLRHFPQSFEFSTLGGWIATRGGGHYATLHTHIDDFVQSVRTVTPAGVCESARLPGSGAGPSPDRLMIGSEGIFGVITEAWMRVVERPKFRASTAVKFSNFFDGVRAAHAVVQSGLNPSNLRLLDHGEAELSNAGDGTHSVLIVGFESADHSLDAPMQRAIELCKDHSGDVPADAGRTRSNADPAQQDKAAGAWRTAFLRMPYVRDVLATYGFVSETFETAVTWDRFEEFHGAMFDEGRRVLNELCGGGVLNCRFTHVYPDGPAPYFTVIAPSTLEQQLECWDEIKSAVSEVLVRHGATITHHHAVGRDHRPWYDRQRPDLFADALRATKGSLDPESILNPGVLIDP